MTYFGIYVKENYFIRGVYNRSAVGVLVQHKTRFVMLCKKFYETVAPDC